jgi:tyrosyl-tRNA synthetase
MAMAHMQQHGHRPIALIGGGTTMVGDPTGKTDMRKMMTKETIADNAVCFKKQLSRFIDFDSDKAIMVNNAEWLLSLNYVDFLREIGSSFSVNRMLSAECYKQRMEKGLTFLEFNYMIMQSYDFLELNRRFNCNLQLGGNDQWSNILGGVDLIRKKERKPAFGLTFTLLTNSEGKKMGKTESGAVWLDANKTSPYEFFQYWRNVDDADVERCLALLTFLPMDEVRRLGALQDSAINEAKEVLAYEITKNVHGEEEAEKAQAAAKALFAGGSDKTNMPTSQLDAARFGEGIGLLALLTEVGLTASNGEARRLVQQGGVTMNDVKITDFRHTVTADDFKDGELILKKGKKKFHRVTI